MICFGSASCRSVIGPETRASSWTNQFKNLKAIATWSPAFFPRFGQFACLYNEFSLASRDSFLSSDWLL